MAESDLRERPGQGETRAAQAGPASADAVDVEDVQGIVRYGHGRLPDVGYLLLRIRERNRARDWLRTLRPGSAAPSHPLPDQVLQVAFSATGLAALGLDARVLEQFSEEFLTGLHEANRARRLGDTDSNAPAHWDWGGSEESSPHVLLMLYTQTGGLDGWLLNLRNLGFEQAFHTLALLRANQLVNVEPFGFADGISQPAIDWEGRQTSDLHRRTRYSNLLALGEVLLGYPNEYGEFTGRPLLPAQENSAARLLPSALDQPGMQDLGRNGTYLVFRQLQQDVQGFWSFLHEAAGGDAERREGLAEAMVGRRRDGSALVPLADKPVPGIPEALRLKDNFAYDDDPRGLACPLAAHIRRSNPRTGDMPPGVTGIFSRAVTTLGFNAERRDQDIVASSRFHRLLRRGRAYGPAFSPEESLLGKGAGEERGLHFICLNASLGRQFEFVQNAWINNGKFAGLQDEDDALLGNRQALYGGTRQSFSCPHAAGPREVLTGLPQFVRVRGAAYFFLPGLRALQYLLTCPPTAEED